MLLLALTNVLQLRMQTLVGMHRKSNSRSFASLGYYDYRANFCGGGEVADLRRRKFCQFTKQAPEIMKPGFCFSMGFEGFLCLGSV